jgi:multiple antibiotic resistance protein
MPGISTIASELFTTTAVSFATLLPIVNPFAAAPIFLLLTGNCSSKTRQRLATRIALNGFLLLTAAGFIGSYVLAFFGVSLPVVQVAGGLVVATAGWNLLRAEEAMPDTEHGTVEKKNEDEALRQAFYPLTLPNTFGPGSLTVAITLGANAPQAKTPLWIWAIAGPLGIAAVAVVVLVVFRYADRAGKLLGPNGMSVFLKLSSFILLCIGTQILWNGISALVQSMR